jgi:hypothetical protein
MKEIDDKVNKLLFLAAWVFLCSTYSIDFFLGKY